MTLAAVGWGVAIAGFGLVDALVPARVLLALAIALPRVWRYDARAAPQGPPPPAHGIAPAPPA